MPEIIIADRIIRSGERPFIIAEAGVNYENCMKTAELMIKEAARAGADAIKFQTYKAEKLAVADSPAYWAETKSQREFFMQYDHFGPDEYRHLAEVCRENGIIFLSTPFDEETADFLDPFIPAYKIASADITHIQFLRHIARKNKPVILSAGASTISEIARAVEVLENNGASQIALMHCILHYPTDYSEANLRSIKYLQKVFPDCIVGYSDHTKPDKGMAIVTAAAVLGASIIEKHFTLDKTLPGNDHYHAMDPDDLALFVENVKNIWLALGTETRKILPGEIEARRYARRSLVAKTKIKKGQQITANNLTAKRPGTGISADNFDLLLGRIAKVDIEADSILQWDMFF